MKLICDCGEEINLTMNPETSGLVQSGGNINVYKEYDFIGVKCEKCGINVSLCTFYEDWNGWRGHKTECSFAKKIKVYKWEITSVYNQFNLIHIYKDDNTEMAIVELNDERIYEGNYHDYYTGCYDRFEIIEEFNSLDEFITNLKKYIEENDGKCKVYEYKYDHNIIYPKV